MLGSTFYSLSQPKGVGNESQEQGIWTQKKENSAYLCKASAGAEIV